MRKQNGTAIDRRKGPDGVEFDATATDGALTHVYRIETHYTWNVRWHRLDFDIAGSFDRLSEERARSVAAHLIMAAEMKSVAVDKIAAESVHSVPITDLHREQFADLIAWSAEKHEENTCAVRI